MDEILLRDTTEADLEFVVQAETQSQQFVTLQSREAHLAAINSDNVAHLIIERQSDAQPVGYTIIAGLAESPSTIELRRIVVTASGQGYGRKALRMIKRFAFERLDAHRLWLDVKEHNARAHKLYESEGFSVEGKLRDCIKTENGYESLLLMSMLKPEYLARRGG
jgi:RimJ/RimL family protein N-acetyltransferase